MSKAGDGEGQQKTGRSMGNDAAMAKTGRRKRSGPTKHAQRLHWLFMEMLQERTEDDLPRFASQAALAEFLGFGKQYVNQIVNISSSGTGGIGADIIEHLMTRVGLLPDWFFAEWSEDEPRPSYKDYLASTKRLAREVHTLQRERVADREMMREVLARLAELEAERSGGVHVSKPKRGR